MIDTAKIGRTLPELHLVALENFVFNSCIRPAIRWSLFLFLGAWSDSVVKPIAHSKVHPDLNRSSQKSSGGDTQTNEQFLQHF
ncbi:MAG: hypothetical protein K0U74_04790 [Alphaproteobacteria bacterium]|nr:hypothetical protein [Alphaproteobacteria bacterium]